MLIIYNWLNVILKAFLISTFLIPDGFVYAVVWSKSHLMTSNKTFRNWNPESLLTSLFLQVWKRIDYRL